MAARLKHDEIIKFLSSLGYTTEDIYKNDKTLMVIKDEHNYLYSITMNNFKFLLKIKKTPAKFSLGNLYTIQNINLWCKLNNKPFKLISTVYENSINKLRWICLKNNCAQEFESNWDNIHFNHGCPYCSGRYPTEENNLLTYDKELCKEWDYRKNDKTPKEYCFSSNQKVWWICLKCGYEWMTSINHRTNGKNGCPKCNNSKGEKEIEKYLINNNIRYNLQYRFENCKYKRALPFDFYLPDHKSCIEYQGEHHYFPIDYNHKGIIWKNNRLNLIKKRDQIKVSYCITNNIKLIIIPYFEFNNISNILKEKLLEVDINVSEI